MNERDRHLLALGIFGGALLLGVVGLIIQQFVGALLLLGLGGLGLWRIDHRRRHTAMDATSSSWTTFLATCVFLAAAIVVITVVDMPTPLRLGLLVGILAIVIASGPLIRRTIR